MGIAAGQYSSMACERGGHTPSRCLKHQVGRAKVNGTAKIRMCFAVKRHQSEAKNQKTIDLKTSLSAADECVDPKVI
jgi:hypothetical protein